jgi:CBS domain-containing protein
MLDDSELTAADVMTSDVVTVRPDTSIRYLAKLMAERRVSGVPVIDEPGHLVGMVSEYDLLLWSDHAPERQAWWLDMLAGDFDLSPDYLDVARGEQQKVRSIMRADPVSISEGTPLREIATLLHDRGVKRLPVVRDGRVVGVVSRGDLVRVLARA